MPSGALHNTACLFILFILYTSAHEFFWVCTANLQRCYKQNGGSRGCQDVIACPHWACYITPWQTLLHCCTHSCRQEHTLISLPDKSAFAALKTSEFWLSICSLWNRPCLPYLNPTRMHLLSDMAFCHHDIHPHTHTQTHTHAQAHAHMSAREGAVAQLCNFTLLASALAPAP